MIPLQFMKIIAENCQRFSRGFLEFAKRLSLNNDILIKLQIYVSLVTGIIITIIGVIFYSISSMLPPCANTIARIVGIILAIVGIILIILAAAR